MILKKSPDVVTYEPLEVLRFDQESWSAEAGEK